MDGQKQDQKQELLEIYKLHAELADRVSQRREGANRLYVSLLVGLLVFTTAILRFGTDGISMDTALLLAQSADLAGPPQGTYRILVDSVLFWTGFLGAALALSWYIVIRSFRQLNTAKINVLRDLEQRLEYPFFTKEWELLGEGKKRTYWRPTVVETVLPWMFLLLFSGLAIFAAPP